MKRIAATEFKTHCLAILDEVARSSEEIVILKRGKPIARLLPILQQGDSPQATLVGSMVASDDLIQPPLPPEAWEAEG